MHDSVAFKLYRLAILFLAGSDWRWGDQITSMLKTQPPDGLSKFFHPG
jgi:hypothetical protein